MDRERFDALARLLATKGSRRGALGTIVGVALFGQDPEEGLAKPGKSKGKAKGHDQGRRKGHDKGRGKGHQKGKGQGHTEDQNQAPEELEREAAPDASDVQAEAQGGRGKSKGKSRGKGNGKDKGRNSRKSRRQQTQAEQVPTRCCGRLSCAKPAKGTNRQNCNYAGQDLSGVNAGGANMQQVDGRGTTFSTQAKPSIWTGVNWYRACLQESTWHSANLDGANFDQACLFDADLTGAKVNNSTNTDSAFFCRTTLWDGTVSDRDCDRGTACCPSCESNEECGDGQICCNGRCRTGDCCAVADCPNRVCETKACVGFTCEYEPVFNNSGPLCPNPRICCEDAQGNPTCCAAGIDACAEDRTCCDGDCTGKICGPDGCGGSCGTCPPNSTCSQDGRSCNCNSGFKPCGDVCIPNASCCTGENEGCTAPTPNCCVIEGQGVCRECCDSDDCTNPAEPICNQSGVCIPCVTPAQCTNAGKGNLCCDGECETGVCCTAADCPDQQCRNKRCTNDHTCNYVNSANGQPGPLCTDSVCCTGVCCTIGDVCDENNQCDCVPDCAGKVCGPDDCGGFCGECPPNSTCNGDGTACVCNSGFKPCGDICIPNASCCTGESEGCLEPTPNCCVIEGIGICRDCCDDDDCSNPTPVCNGSGVCVACANDEQCGMGEVCCDGSCFEGVCCVAADCPDEICQTKSCESDHTCDYVDSPDGQPGPLCLDSICCSGICCPEDGSVCDTSDECCVPDTFQVTCDPVGGPQRCGTSVVNNCGELVNCGDCDAVLCQTANCVGAPDGTCQYTPVGNNLPGPLCPGPGFCCGGDECCTSAQVCFSNNCCTPNSDPVTCQGRCGTVTNNCGQSVQCPACPTLTCQTNTCDAGTQTCIAADQPDGLPGNNCPDPRQCCNGICCLAGQSCVGGVCVANCGSNPPCGEGFVCCGDTCVENICCGIDAGCTTSDDCCDGTECVPETDTCQVICQIANECQAFFGDDDWVCVGEPDFCGPDKCCRPSSCNTSSQCGGDVCCDNEFCCNPNFACVGGACVCQSPNTVCGLRCCDEDQVCNVGTQTCVAAITLASTRRPRRERRTRRRNR